MKVYTALEMDRYNVLLFFFVQESAGRFQRIWKLFGLVLQPLYPFASLENVLCFFQKDVSFSLERSGLHRAFFSPAVFFRALRLGSSFISND